jgi:hypothetical protein
MWDTPPTLIIVHVDLIQHFIEDNVLQLQLITEWVTITLGRLKLKLKLIYDRRSVGQSVLVSGSHLEPMTSTFFSIWRLRISWCVAPSLTRGWVCNLLVQLLLGLARAVTLGSKSSRTHDYILISHLKLKLKLIYDRRSVGQSVLVRMVWPRSMYLPSCYGHFLRERLRGSRLLVYNNSTRRHIPEDSILQAARNFIRISIDEVSSSILIVCQTRYMLRMDLNER